MYLGLLLKHVYHFSMLERVSIPRLRGSEKAAHWFDDQKGLYDDVKTNQQNKYLDRLDKLRDELRQQVRNAT